MIILSTDDYYFKYTFSESFSNQQYSDYIYPRNSISNQTSLNDGCDFLNLCGKYTENKLSETNLNFNSKIVDVSYLNSYIKLPFP